MSATAMAATAVAAFPDFAVAGTSDATISGGNHGAFQQKPWDRQTRVHLYTQFVMSSLLGVGAFITFCVCAPCLSTFDAAHRRAMTTWKLTDYNDRSYDRDGVNYMPRVESSAMQRQDYPICQKVSLDGYPLFGGLRTRKS